jgi:transmembrane 9 superfamily protein 2/4
MFHVRLVFGSFLLLNFFLIGGNSAGAVPFLTMLALTAMWFGVSVPLSFLGSFIGFKSAVVSCLILENHNASESQSNSSSNS